MMNQSRPKKNFAFLALSAFSFLPPAFAEEVSLSFDQSEYYFTLGAGQEITASVQAQQRAHVNHIYFLAVLNQDLPDHIKVITEGCDALMVGTSCTLRFLSDEDLTEPQYQIPVTLFDEYGSIVATEPVTLKPEQATLRSSGEAIFTDPEQEQTISFTNASTHVPIQISWENLEGHENTDFEIIQSCAGVLLAPSEHCDVRMKALEHYSARTTLKLYNSYAPHHPLAGAEVNIPVPALSYQFNQQPVTPEDILKIASSGGQYALTLENLDSKIGLRGLVFYYDEQFGAHSGVSISHPASSIEPQGRITVSFGEHITPAQSEPDANRHTSFDIEHNDLGSAQQAGRQVKRGEPIAQFDLVLETPNSPPKPLIKQVKESNAAVDLRVSIQNYVTENSNSLYLDGFDPLDYLTPLASYPDHADDPVCNFGETELIADGVACLTAFAIHPEQFPFDNLFAFGVAHSQTQLHYHAEKNNFTHPLELNIRSGLMTADALIYEDEEGYDFEVKGVLASFQQNLKFAVQDSRGAYYYVDNTQSTDIFQYIPSTQRLTRITPSEQQAKITAMTIEEDVIYFATDHLDEVTHAYSVQVLNTETLTFDTLTALPCNGTDKRCPNRPITHISASKLPEIGARLFISGNFVDNLNPELPAVHIEYYEPGSQNGWRVLPDAPLARSIWMLAGDQQGTLHWGYQNMDGELMLSSFTCSESKNCQWLAPRNISALKHEDISEIFSHNIDFSVKKSPWGSVLGDGSLVIGFDAHPEGYTHYDQCDQTWVSVLIQATPLASKPFALAYSAGGHRLSQESACAANHADYINAHRITPIVYHDGPWDVLFTECLGSDAVCYPAGQEMLYAQPFSFYHRKDHRFYNLTASQKLTQLKSPYTLMGVERSVSVANGTQVHSPQQQH